MVREGFWGHMTIVATDGKRSEDTVRLGAAFWDGRGGEAGLFRLPDGATVFLAEAIALREALRYAQRTAAARVVILSDSQSVLKALQSTPTAKTSEILVDIRRMLLAANDAGREVSLCWVPAHVGIPPNELADDLANIARTAGRMVTCPLPPSTWNQAITDSVMATWKVMWSTDPFGRHLHHLHHLQPQPTLRPWFHHADGARRAITTISRLRLGHTHALKHLHRCAGVPSPRCICGKPEGTAAHVLLHCPLLNHTAFFNVPLQTLLARPTSELIAAVTAFLASNPDASVWV